MEGHVVPGWEGHPMVGRKRVVAVGITILAGLGVMTIAPAAQASIIYSQIIARHSNKCLDIGGADLRNGIRVIQWDCLAQQRNQHFMFVRVGLTSYYELVARHSGKCLDVVQAATGDGVPIWQWDCLPQALNQQFRIQLVT